MQKVDKNNTDNLTEEKCLEDYQNTQKSYQAEEAFQL